MGPGRAPGTPIRGRSSAVPQNAESAPLGYRSERNAELIGIGFPSPTNTEEQGGADRHQHASAGFGAMQQTLGAVAVDIDIEVEPRLIVAFAKSISMLPLSDKQRAWSGTEGFEAFHYWSVLDVSLLDSQHCSICASQSLAIQSRV